MDQRNDILWTYQGEDVHSIAKIKFIRSALSSVYKRALIKRWSAMNIHLSSVKDECRLAVSQIQLRGVNWVPFKGNAVARR